MYVAVPRSNRARDARATINLAHNCLSSDRVLGRTTWREYRVLSLVQIDTIRHNNLDSLFRRSWENVSACLIDWFPTVTLLSWVWKIMPRWIADVLSDYLATFHISCAKRLIICFSLAALMNLKIVQRELLMTEVHRILYIILSTRLSQTEVYQKTCC